ncbi:MAG: YdcF family protein [Spirulinaceae cyanobacterium]
MQRWRRQFMRLLQILLGLLCVAAIALAAQLYRHAQAPTDAVLVLGGSIRREIYAAQLAQELPDVPILISGGSQTPCISLIFEREQASLEQVYSDRCARGTWGNFYHSTPILRSWQARHVRLVTSPSHLPRALWMARLHLGIHGIWVELDQVAETGQPGNQERPWKTALDLIRTAGSAIASLFEPARPHCPLIRPPQARDWASWEQLKPKVKPAKIHCEHQASLDGLVTQWGAQLERYRQAQ